GVLYFSVKPRAPVRVLLSFPTRRSSDLLGGKNPNVIFKDADIDVAIDNALNAVYFHAGQVCSAGTRLIIEDDIHDTFVEALKKRVENIVLGDGMDDNTEMGPLISKEH